MSDLDEQSFSSRLYELPSNYAHIQNVALDVPADASRAFGRRGYVPVIGAADGFPIRATFVPIGEGRHRLFLDQQVRQAIGRGPGDEVEIAVRLDTSDRMPDLPDDLEAALRDQNALAAWEALRPSRRKECLVVLADAKTTGTRLKRIARIVATALEVGSDRRR